MNDNYIKNYVDLTGNINHRKILSQIKIKIYAGIKFMSDRLLAIIGLIMASPIMILIAISIKLDSKGPILFKQKRTGKHGKIFTMYKFRTMVANNDVYDFTKKDEHTRIGNFLRRTSLDEIPQFFSIAIGDMSFIGPRPWISDYYDNMNEYQKHRCDVRPGLTGLAQVKGRNNINIVEKIEYDLEYIKNYSLIQDIKIIFLTIKTVFKKNGVDAGKETIKKELEELKKQNNHKKKKSDEIIVKNNTTKEKVNRK